MSPPNIWSHDANEVEGNLIFCCSVAVLNDGTGFYFLVPRMHAYVACTEVSMHVSGVSMQVSEVSMQVLCISVRLRRICVADFSDLHLHRRFFGVASALQGMNVGIRRFCIMCICVAEFLALHLRCRKFCNAYALQKNLQRRCTQMQVPGETCWY